MIERSANVRVRVFKIKRAERNKCEGFGGCYDSVTNSTKLPPGVAHDVMQTVIHAEYGMGTGAAPDARPFVNVPDHTTGVETLSVFTVIWHGLFTGFEPSTKNALAEMEVNTPGEATGTLKFVGFSAQYGPYPGTSGKDPEI